MFKTKNIYSLKERFVKDIKKGSKKDWSLIAIIWIAIILTFVTGIGVRADDSIEFGKNLIDVQEEYSDLYRLQIAIRKCEGWDKKNSLSYRNNNPGNIKSGVKRDSQGHGVFDTKTEGYIAHLELLQRRYWGHTPKYMNHVLGYAEDPNWFRCVNYYY